MTQTGRADRSSK